MDELKGRSILKECFLRAGYRVAEDVPLALGAHRVMLDGFDEGMRVGYEYITTAAGDREEVTPAVREALEEAMGRGLLWVLLIDEQEVGSPLSLERAAERFLAQVAQRRVP